MINDGENAIEISYSAAVALADEQRICISRFLRKLVGNNEFHELN